MPCERPFDARLGLGRIAKASLNVNELWDERSLCSQAELFLVRICFAIERSLNRHRHLIAQGKSKIAYNHSRGLRMKSFSAPEATLGKVLTCLKLNEDEFIARALYIRSALDYKSSCANPSHLNAMRPCLFVSNGGSCQPRAVGLLLKSELD